MAASAPAQEPATTTPPANASDDIHQRLSHVVAGVGALAKSGHNDFHNYDFVPFGAIQDAIKTGLQAQRVAMHSYINESSFEVVSGQDADGRGKRSILASARGELVFVNLDNVADVLAIPWVGIAIDSSDKAMAKAITSGRKSALLAEFMVSVDDPDKSADTLPGGSDRHRSGGGQGQWRGRQGPGPSDYGRPDDSGAPWPGDEGGPQGSQEARGGDGGRDPGVCPRHGKAWRHGNRGYYCATKVGDGWCQERPSEAWAARNER